MAELAARTTGYCGGKGGSLHMTDFSLGILGANGIVGGASPSPWAPRWLPAEKRSPGGSVILRRWRDQRGRLPRSVNLAGLWKLPAGVTLRKTTSTGEGTPQEKQAPVTTWRYERVATRCRS